mgnify:CR=1 FL=1
MKYLLYLCVVILLVIIAGSFILKKETFLPNGYHSCYPYSHRLNAYNSYKSLSNGWCSTGKYGGFSDDDEFDEYDKSKLKCQEGYVRVSPLESYNYEDKAWCKIPNM